MVYGNCNYVWLLVSNMNCIFHNIWDVILPIDSYFSEGFKPPTSSGKHTKIHGQLAFLMGKSTISMAMFNSKLLNYQRVTMDEPLIHLEQMVSFHIFPQMCLLTGKPGTIPSCKTWKTWELLENPVALVRNIQQDDQHVHPASVCTPYLVGGFQHVFHHIIRIYI